MARVATLLGGATDSNSPRSEQGHGALCAVVEKTTSAMQLFVASRTHGTEGGNNPAPWSGLEGKKLTATGEVFFPWLPLWNLPGPDRFRHGIIGTIPKAMRRKRLQHVADTMCQMFCGWRLIESKPNLLKLGSGTLEIDVITGQCVFQGKTTGQLTIAEEIRAWLQQDLATNKIPIMALTGAQLAVKLSFSVVPWNEPTREIFYSNGKAIRTEKMNRCVMECNSNVTTDESVYRSKLMEVQHWPLGWPNSTAPNPD